MFSMSSKIARGALISTLSIFVLAGIAFGKSKSVSIIYKARVGPSLELMPGNYRINLLDSQQTPEVEFYHYGKLLGEVPAKVIPATRKNSRTQVDYTKLASNREVLTEIRPSGWNRNLYFSHSPNNKTASN